MRKKLSKTPTSQASQASASSDPSADGPSSSSASSTTAAAAAAAAAFAPTAPPAASNFLGDALPLPHLVVFDLDYTLWPFWVDTHVNGALKANAAHSAATDRLGETYAFYADVPRILQTLSLSGGAAPGAGSSSSDDFRVRIGAASRTQAPDLAREMLKLLHVAGAGKGGRGRRALDFFDAGLEIFPGSKLSHFRNLHKRTGIDYSDMLFFDDEFRNKEVESLGVTMCLVRDGMSWGELERGIGEWRRRQKGV